MKRTEIKAIPSKSDFTAYTEHMMFNPPSGNVKGLLTVFLGKKGGKENAVGNCTFLVDETPDITIKYPKAVHIDDIQAINAVLNEFQSMAAKLDSGAAK